MEGNERYLQPFLDQSRSQILLGIHLHHLIAKALQCGSNRQSGAQADLALDRQPSHQNADSLAFQLLLARADHWKIPTFLTSGFSSTPLWENTRDWASSISATMSRARAPPRLTIQFAWSAEIWARPMVCPLRPTRSMILPAKSPGGFWKTLPKLG